ncbi:hypothetical protein SNA86_16690 [Escherichia coli]|nr:hypothetical protein [Escherichia coli]
MNNKKFWSTFLFVCVCGFFVALAGGVEWGTENCGAMVGDTLLLAGMLAFIRS